MRAVAQRVSSASVEVGGEIVGAIEAGLLVYLGVGHHDAEREVVKMAQKLVGLRIFEDEAQKMSRSVQDIAGDLLIISQFTLFGDVRRGRRPSFTAAAPPDQAAQLYDALCAEAQRLIAPRKVERGRFGATMNVRACVAGPVTILFDTDNTF